MKRARPPWVEGDSAESSTLFEHEPSYTDPFHRPQVWQDFWFEVLEFLSPMALHKLSRVSKTLNSLVWTHLIPASPFGMVFSPSTEAQKIGSYLTRIPSLKRLDFSSFQPEELDFVLSTAKKTISKLSSLCLPLIDFQFHQLSYLTDLIHLTDVMDPNRGPAPTWDEEISTENVSFIEVPLSHFGKLRTLSFNFATPLVLAEILRLTQLENLTLTFECHEDSETPLDLSRLTRLETLSLGKEYIGDWWPDPWPAPSEIGLGHLTNLKSFKMIDVLGALQISLRELTKLTKMETLKFHLNQIGDIRDPVSFGNLAQILTNLRSLKTHDEHCDSEDIPPESMECLLYMTNLTKLNMKTYFFSPSFIASLASLNSLTDIYFSHGDLLEDMERTTAMGLLTNLKRLSMDQGQLWALTNMVNLTELYLPSSVEPSSEISRLTNLQSIHLWDFEPLKAPGFDCLTNLTFLHIIHRRANLAFGRQLIQDQIPFLSTLKVFHLENPIPTQALIDCISLHLTRLEFLNFSQPYPDRQEKVLICLSPLLKLTRLQKLRPDVYSQEFKLLLD